MTFKKIFDRNAAIDAGLFPIWMALSIATLFLPGFQDASAGVGLVVPFGWLIGLHWLFRFGRWIEYRLRPKKSAAVMGMACRRPKGEL